MTNWQKFEYKEPKWNYKQAYGFPEDREEDPTYSSEEDYFMTDGCCLCCKIPVSGCWCAACKCKKCTWRMEERDDQGRVCWIASQGARIWKRRVHR